MLLGGLIESDSEDRSAYPTNQTLMLDIRYPEIYRGLNPLPRDFVSIFPAFYDEDGLLLLINEDGRSDSPEVLRYDINKYLGNPSNLLMENDDVLWIRNNPLILNCISDIVNCHNNITF